MRTFTRRESLTKIRKGLGSFKRDIARTGKNLQARAERQKADPNFVPVVVCISCTKKALYRVGREGFCKDHRDQALEAQKVRNKIFPPERLWRA